MTSASEQSSPQGWCKRQLHDLCHVVGGGTPSRSQPKYWNGDIPWASVKDFSDEAVFLHDTKEHITQEGLESSASTLIQANTPVVCTRMAVGRCALTTRPTAINQDLKALLLRDGFDSRFFIRLLKLRGPILDRVSVGSTVRGITTHDLLSLVLCYPDKFEQSRITAVLDTVDEAIAKTEAVIVKLKQVRAGLLHDILTRGLDEHGQLRDPVAHPGQFQDSLFGQIPRAWAVGSVDGTVSRPSDLTIGPFGSNLLASDYKPEGAPVVFVRDIRENSFVWNSDIYVSQDKADELRAHCVLAGDVLITKMGLPPCIAAVYPNTMPSGVITADVIRLRPRVDIATSFWLAAYINSPRFAACVRKITGGVTRPKVTLADFREQPVLLPSVEEQQRIENMVRAMACGIEEVEAESRKLLMVKSGLMADLLTGRVHVPEEITVAP